MGKYIELIDETTPDLAVGSIYIGTTSAETYDEVTDDDYGDYFTDAVALLYDACGTEATFATSTINITNFSTAGSSSVETEFKTNIYPEHFNSLHRYAYSTIEGYPFYDHDGKYEDCTFRIPIDSYFYVRGSDPDTRRFIQFSYNNNQLYYKIWNHEKTRVIYETYGSPFSFENVTVPAHMISKFLLTDIEDFVNATSAQAARAYVGQATMSISYTHYADTVVDSKIQYRVTKYFQNSNALDGLYHLLQSGAEYMDPDEDPYSGDDGPYEPGGPDEGSGDRPPYDEGDDIPIPDLPPFNLSDSGFTSLWIPSRTTLGLLSSYLWSDNLIDTIIKKLYANPIDVIISLGIVPFDVTPDGTAEICVGTHGTGITSAYVNSDTAIIDCGDVSISEMKPGGYLNFSPYTEAKIFLPFVGFVDVDTDVIMTSTVHIEYHVCLTNGSFVAFIESTNVNTSKVIGEYEGNMKITVPITAADYSSMWQAIIGTLSAPLLAAAGGAAAGAIGGQYIGASAALTSDFAAEGANQGLSNSIGQGITNAGNHITDKLSPNISCSSGFSAGSGMMGNRKPFIVLKSPEVKQPGNYNKYRGYPLQAECKLSSLQGYTEISNIQLALTGASGTETGEVERLLRSGVIIGNGTKPSTVNDGILLCSNKSPLNQINKSVTLVSQLNGDFRNSINMMQPVVRIERTSPLDFNYVYIGEFRRWYFLNKVEIVRTGILDLYLKEDVLESFASDILNHNAIVSNNANLYNVYLNDKQLITTQRSLFWRKEFPTGFFENDNYEWVMLIAGSRGGTDSSEFERMVEYSNRKERERIKN